MPVLNGIDLGSDIHIEDEHAISRIISVMERSRGDAVLIWEDNAGPQPFDLVGESNKGVLTKALMDQLKELASSPNQQFQLEYNGETKTVRFRHWDGEVINGTPLGGREVMTGNDVFTNVRIKLMEV